jgi:hypothetical protein
MSTVCVGIGVVSLLSDRILIYLSVSINLSRLSPRKRNSSIESIQHGDIRSRVLRTPGATPSSTSSAIALTPLWTMWVAHDPLEQWMRFHPAVMVALGHTLPPRNGH